MRVYQAATLLDDEVQALMAAVPRGNGFGKDIDQLQRAVGSIPYNIAEAFGSEQPGKKINHLEIARGSSDETRAVLRRLAGRGAFAPKAIARPCVLTSAIAKMLASWIRSIRVQGRHNCA